MRYIFLIQLFFLSYLSLSQVTIKGKVTDTSGEELIGANVYIQDSYDGGTTDFSGNFHFETYETGDQILIISFVGYETLEHSINVDQSQEIDLNLKEAFNSIEAVTITAGSFEASDKKKAVVLNSLDIATTAGATADITGALNTLPGTQKVGESGRLFVRGGTADETRIYIDGVEAANYYGASANGVPTRSRFSPFLFKGTFFSTGGYSAEYGQALSSALSLNTLDVDPENKIDLSLMSVGFDAAVTRSWNDQSIYAKAGYLNLNPYNNVIDQRVNWIDGTVSWDGTMAYKKKLANGGMIKALGMVNTADFHLQEHTILNEQGYNDIEISNRNSFVTANVNLPVGEKDNVFFGVSSAWDNNAVGYNESGIDNPQYNFHAKLKFNHEFNPKQTLNTGAEVYYLSSKQKLGDDQDTLDLSFENHNLAYYAEINQYLSENLVLRVGGRLSHQMALNATTLEPRFSIAYKFGAHGQISVASGQFYQNPMTDYLLINDNLKQERAQHYIFNFQHIKGNNVFRVETYLKDYDRLIRYTDPYDASTFTNKGKGYAYGVDVFWRNRGGFKNIDYWISYSWMNSERLFRDYTEKATPTFATAHNASFVIKKFVPSLKTQFGATYSITSGRPYDNPNKEGFNESRTRVYHDLSFNAAYLPTPELIIYVSATNLLGQDQVFGYRYANSPNDQGMFTSEAIRLPAKRFLFVGCFLTIGAFNKQIENL